MRHSQVWIMAVRLYHKVDVIYASAGDPPRVCLTGCLSRVTGNCHARFLGGSGLVTAPGYPVRITEEIEMPNIPAICLNQNCKNIFPSGFSLSKSRNITFTNCTSGPCPRCGSNGTIPNGIYDSTGDNIFAKSFGCGSFRTTCTKV